MQGKSNHGVPCLHCLAACFCCNPERATLVQACVLCHASGNAWCHASGNVWSGGEQEVSACVAEEEEYGYVVSLGIPGAKGFLPKNDMAPG